MENTSLIQFRALLARQQLLHQQQHKRLARQIHDQISQQLTLLTLQLSLAASDAKPPANWAHHCKQWSAAILALGQNVRQIINELHPPILDEFGLGAALQWYAHSCPAGVHCQVFLPAEPVALPPAAANELFAVCRDIVHEVLAPNGIMEAALVLERTPDLLLLHLRTNERNPALEPLVSTAMDALSIHERLFWVDGALESHQDPAKGLAITLALPAGRQMASDAA